MARGQLILDYRGTQDPLLGKEVQIPDHSLGEGCLLRIVSVAHIDNKVCGYRGVTVPGGEVKILEREICGPGQVKVDNDIYAVFIGPRAHKIEKLHDSESSEEKAADALAKALRTAFNLNMQNPPKKSRRK